VLDGGPPEREHFRPRIGGRGSEVPPERVPRLWNALLSRIARIGRSSRPGRGRAPGMFSERDVPRPGASARRCIVKARFAMNAYGVRAASPHLVAPWFPRCPRNAYQRSSAERLRSNGRWSIERGVVGRPRRVRLTPQLLMSPPEWLSRHVARQVQASPSVFRLRSRLRVLAGSTQHVVRCLG